jgi:hypothetical protein
LIIGIIRKSSALFEPIHGSFQKENRNIANPIASIRILQLCWSIWLLLKVYWSCAKKSNWIECSHLIWIHIFKFEQLVGDFIANYIFKDDLVLKVIMYHRSTIV